MKTDKKLADIENIKDIIPDELPVVALRDTVIFPNTMYPILVGREGSVQAINTALADEKMVLLVAQKEINEENPDAAGLYKTGTVAYITQAMRLPNSLIKVLVNGLLPADIEDISYENTASLGNPTGIDGKPETSFWMRARVKVRETKKVRKNSKLSALIRKCHEKFERYVLVNQDLPEEVLTSFSDDENPEQTLYLIASYLELDIHEKQKLLEAATLEMQFKKLLTFLTRELELVMVSSEINEKVQDEIQETQRKFFIQEQIKALQDELDEGDYGDPDLIRLKEQVTAANMPEDVLAKANEELERLKKTPQMSPEYGVARNYLDWLVALPWDTFSEDNLDILKVEEILNQDHFGLEKAKDRILEHIAVLNLVKSMKGQILCFVGPPGVGKTSMGKSIANALGRKMVRISLGGVSDEAEIRGHRRTYIGSMPGRIIQGIRKAGTVNPVIVLDEIDKVGHDFRGDPSSAILEVLDPEQNNTFNDHYLDVDYDLSKVLFVATANVASSIQPALLDRMEVINLPGYLEHEKLEIAKRHLIPKKLQAHGLPESGIKFKDDAILYIVRKYTSEAGVRALEQQIAAVCRKLARQFVTAQKKEEADGKKKRKKTFRKTVNEKTVRELLGVEKHRDRDPQRLDKLGSVSGLAWTSTGGAILQIDVAVMKGKSNFRLTGKLGDVMKESAQAALTYLRANAKKYGIDDGYFENHELHIHIPEGAIPKDGPSAGMAMCLAMLSLLTENPTRHDVAMTGEMTLRGEVLAIGGLNEKLLAAQRHSIKKVLIPAENMPDMEEIPAKVKEGLEIVSVSTIDEAVEHVFRSQAKKAKGKKKS